MRATTAPNTLIAPLSNGVQLPPVGLGTGLSLQGAKGLSVLRTAIRLGYRHIDTGQLYGNEALIGRAIAGSGVSRHEFIVSSKYYGACEMGQSGALLRALNGSLSRLGVSHLDVYLIHFPGILDKDRRRCAGALPNGPAMRRTMWSEMVQAYQAGLVRSVGVANFGWRHLEPLLSSAVSPMVLQTEYSLLHHDEELRQRCRSRNILLIGYGSLSTMFIAPNAETTRLLAGIAKAHNASPTQVALSWTTRRGVAIIPRSFSASHLADNLRASSAPCELTEAEDTALASLSARVPSRDLYGTRKVAARTP